MPKTKKYFTVSRNAVISTGFVIILLAGLGGYLFGKYYDVSKTEGNPPSSSCTTEARECPDGTFVSRVGPKCEFAPCPQTTAPKLSPTPIPTKSNAAVPTANYSRPSSWKTASINVNGHTVSVCLPPDWKLEPDTTHVFYNRDAGYQPDVFWINNMEYKGGSRREEYLNQKVRYESEPEKLKAQTSVKEVNINGKSVLYVSMPTFPDAVIFVHNNQLYEFTLGYWNMVNDSRTAYLKDLYTVIGCFK